MPLLLTTKTAARLAAVVSSPQGMVGLHAGVPCLAISLAPTVETLENTVFSDPTPAQTCCRRWACNCYTYRAPGESSGGETEHAYAVLLLQAYV